MVATSGPRVRSVAAEAYTIPTDAPESDGTLKWDRTTLVLVRAGAGGEEGLGYTYASPAAAEVVRIELAPVVEGRSALAPAAAWEAMRDALRNVGRAGIGSCALSAMDTALWDLRARLLDMPLADLLGRLRDAVPAYASGGFTSLGAEGVARQLGGWAESGFSMVKMKVGREPAADPARVAAARRAIGDDVALFVDANGAFDPQTALGWAHRFAEHDISWFEEPVSSDDLAGLRLVREHGPPGMHVAAGEYGWSLTHFRRLLEAGAVDTVQVDVTRCGGYTPFLRIAALCEAHGRPLSAHCAPALHLPVMCAAPRAAHCEYFDDHVRIEERLFEGFPRAEQGMLSPDGARPGHGLAFRDADAAPFRVAGP